MSEHDTRPVMTEIDWDTAVAAVIGFLNQEAFPSTLEDQQLAKLALSIAAARKRLQEKA